MRKTIKTTFICVQNPSWKKQLQVVKRELKKLSTISAIEIKEKTNAIKPRRPR